MKRITAIVLLLTVVLLLSSCSKASELYGTWYRDADGERNAMQFSESNDGKDAFIWAVYDINKNEVKSDTRGYYTIDGDKLTLKYPSGNADVTLTYKIDGDKLTLTSDGAELVLTKYKLN